MNRNYLTTMLSGGLSFLFALPLPMRAAAKMGTARTIIAMERAALDRWGMGDPDGFLAIGDPGVTYFDPFQERRLDGLEGLRSLYEQLRGTIRIDRYEMIDPKVQAFGDIAVLTYNFVSFGNEGQMGWNCTEVYRHSKSAWRIIHTHWSFTKPSLSSGK